MSYYVALLAVLLSPKSRNGHFEAYRHPSVPCTYVVYVSKTCNCRSIVYREPDALWRTIQVIVDHSWLSSSHQDQANSLRLLLAFLPCINITLSTRHSVYSHPKKSIIVTSYISFIRSICQSPQTPFAGRISATAILFLSLSEA